MKLWKKPSWRRLLSGLLTIGLLSMAACGGESTIDASRGYDPTPTPSPVG